jgi:hypothetical protein
MIMKSQENLNEPVIGSTTLKWSAPEVKILDSDNAEFGFGKGIDAGTTEAS